MNIKAKDDNNKSGSIHITPLTGEPPSAINTKSMLGEVKTEAEVVGSEAEPDISTFRPDRDGIRKVLGDLEADIMEYIWETLNITNKPGITVREVYEAFRQGRVVAYTTIMSTMTRLAAKHMLQVEKIEAAYIYKPSMSKSDFIDKLVSRILDDLLVSFSTTTQVYLERLIDPANSERLSNLQAKLESLRRTQNE